MRIHGFLPALFLFFFVVTLPPTAHAQALIHDWSQRFGDPGYFQSARAIVADASNNIIVTGQFQGTVNFGGGPLADAGGYDIFVAKFNASGNHIWSQRFGDADDQKPYGMAVDGSGNIVVTGQFRGTVDFGGGSLTSDGRDDIFIAKFNPDGIHLWSKRFGDSIEDRGCGVATDGSGNVIVAGYFQGAVDFGGGLLWKPGAPDMDIFVVKFNADGDHLWSQRFGDAGIQSPYCVTSDGAGNVITGGYFYGTVDFGGGPLSSAGFYDIFVASFDPDGNHLWSGRYGDSATQSASDIATDGSGNVIVAGAFTGTVDFGGGPLTDAGDYDVFVAKFTAGGDHLWSQRFGDHHDQQPRGIAVDGTGDIFLTGYFKSTIDFGSGALTSAGFSDIFIVRFDADGVHEWSQRFGDADNDLTFAITADGSGGVVAAGEFEGTIDLGGGLLASAGGYDILVARFSTDPAGPTRLVAFNTSAHRGGVKITWRLSEISHDARFHVLRADAGQPFAELRGARTQLRGLDGEFTDTAVQPDKAYRYRVDVSDEDGRQTLFVTGEITVPAAALALGPVMPNPFNPATTIHYTVPEASRVELSIYDTHGKLVRTLVNRVVPAGAGSVLWNGRDDRDMAMPSGVYFVRLTSGKWVRTSKIVLLK